jgi:hypothetical protein
MCERLLDNAYEKFIACGSSVTAFAGVRVVLVVDSACGLDTAAWDLSIVGRLIFDIERLLSAFDACVGRLPSVGAAYMGRPTRIEVAFLDHAAGLAHHGISGCAIGPAFIAQALDAAAASDDESAPIVIPHVICYELCRNYIFPEEFTPVLDYCLRESRLSAQLAPACWGWVNQGMVNILGTLLLDELQDPRVSFSYHGHSREKFLADMEAHFNKYVESDLAWDEVFMHERLPWDGASSLDNVYSGLIIRLWRLHGAVFLTRFFAALRSLEPPSSKSDVEKARENFAVAAARAARVDLSDFFKTLRWPLREPARRLVANVDLR